MTFEDKIRWISVSLTDQQLSELKCQYNYVINSKRKYSQIKDFVDLTGILMARGVTGQDDITDLNQISRKYFGIDFNKILEPRVIPQSSNGMREQLNQPPLLFSSEVNLNLIDSRANLHAHSINTHSHSENSTEETSSSISQDIIEILATRLEGRQWRPFARALNVGESNITIISSNEENLANKIRRVLQIFQQNTQRRHQWPLLEVALELVGRLDLRDRCFLLVHSRAFERFTRVNKTLFYGCSK